MREEDEILGFSDGISTQETETPSTHDADSLKDAATGAAVSGIDNPADNERLDSENKHHDTQLEPFEEEGNNIPDTIHNQLPDENRRSDAELERELNQLFLGTRNDRTNGASEGKQKLGAAKAKRQKRAEKQAVLEAEGKGPSKSKGPRKAYDPSAAIQKARGETVTTGRKSVKKK
jgi:hypothetical protein